MSVFDIKLVLLGCSGCGKTALLHRLVHGRYRPGLPPTYAAEFGAKRVQVAVPGSRSTNGSGPEGRCRSAGGRASDTAGSRESTNGGDGERRGVSVGVWDTSGGARFHSQSRRFIAGADAVLVCWDATSRDSWEAMRAWVADARAEDPAVRIYLAACKSDLVMRHSRQLHIDVQVERWPSREQQQQQAWQRSRAPSQQGQQLESNKRSMPQQQDMGAKPPLHGGTPSGLHEPLPSAPRTPLKAERPQSPAEELESEAAAALLAAGKGRAEAAAAAAAAAARRVLAEHQAAAAAELVSSLTGETLPSPFAAAAARPLSPAEEPAAGSPAAASAVSTRGSSLPATLSSAPSMPAGRAGSAEVTTAERKASPGRRRGGPPHVRLPSISPDDEAAAGGRQSRHGRQGEGSEEEEEPSPRRPPARQPPAVPEAAVEQYCASLGTQMFWVSARTGEGVLDAVTTIAQDVVDQRLLVWRLQQAQQQAQQAQQAQQHGQQQPGRRSPWGSLHSGSLAPQQAQRAQQAQQQAQQRGRSRSADSYGRQLAAAESSLLSSRGRVVRRSTDSSSSMRSASAGPAGREYVVRGSELGSPPRQLEEPSCVIC